MYYKKYTRCFHMLIGQNYQFTPADMYHAKKGSKIILKDDSFHDYYHELYKKFGTYAKFDLLGELEIRRGWGKNIQTIALKSTYGRAKKLSSLTLITFPTNISCGNIFALPLVNSTSPIFGFFSSFTNELVK